MKNFIFGLLAIFIISMTMTSCSENYSNGERIGMITKFSQKGLVFDSWEGTLNTTQTGMNSAEPFDFSVDRLVNDPEVILMLDSAATYGWKVKVEYHEVVGLNFFKYRGETNYFVKHVQVLDRDPVKNLFGNREPELSQKTMDQFIRGNDTVYVVIIDQTK